MKIRRYIGSNTQEAILKVKMDLGNDALILNTKKVKQKGILKFFAKPMVEVLAAIDENKIESKAKPVVRENFNPEGNNEVKNTVMPSSDFKDKKLEQLESKVNHIEGILQKIYEKVNPSTIDESKTSQEKRNSSWYLQLFYNNLVKSDVEPDVAKMVIDRSAEKISDDCGVNETASIVYNVVNSMLGTPRPITLNKDGKPTIAVFVGPTGVGKTTTLAKIAANFTLNHNKSVGLITTDTFRISAVDQLKTYAEIMGIPVSVLYSVDDISQAIENFCSKDLILIDTAGRSYKDKQQFEDVKRIVQLTGTEDVYLVLSSTTNYKIIKNITENYSFLNYYKLILTKMDESATPGIILNTRYFAEKDLSYITTGQSVPDDIELADTDKITKNLIGSIC